MEHSVKSKYSTTRVRNTLFVMDMRDRQSMYLDSIKQCIIAKRQGTHDMSRDMCHDTDKSFEQAGIDDFPLTKLMECVMFNDKCMHY